MRVQLTGQALIQPLINGLIVKLILRFLRIIAKKIDSTAKKSQRTKKSVQLRQMISVNLLRTKSERFGVP